MASPDNNISADGGNRVTQIRDTAAQDVAHAAPRKSRLGLVAMGVGMLVAIALAWPVVTQWASAELSVPQARVRIASVVEETFTREVSARGTVIAAVSPTLYAPADGIVTLEVDAGDLVEQDDLLATIASPEIENRLALERSTLAAMETELERRDIERRRQQLQSRQTEDLARVAVIAAERELRRAEAAWEERVIKEQDYDKARDDLDAARLTHTHAVDNARLERDSLAFELRSAGLARDRQQLTVTDLERQLGELAIRSPVTGMVGTVAVAERQAVTDNTPIVTVVDMTAYEIEMVVPESYAEELAIGLPAIVEIGRNEYPGRVRAVSPEIDNGQVRGRIRFDDTAPDGLRQNQRVSIRLQFETRDDALVVRRGPFYDDGGGRVAYVVDGNRAYRRAIRTGAVSVDQVEIIDGVEAGERIVISSHEPFRNADTVLLTQ